MVADAGAGLGDEQVARHGGEEAERRPAVERRGLRHVDRHLSAG